MIIRTLEQNLILAEELMERAPEERRAINILGPHLVEGKIVEFGCGNGVILELLSQLFPNSIITGVDLSMTMLDMVNKKRLKNVVVVCANILDTVFPEGAFDTAIFYKSFHEIYSFLGANKAEDALNMAYRSLKKDGILLIRDTIMPVKQLVKIKFNDQHLELLYKRFCREFTLRSVPVIKEDEWFILDIADALEYLTKYWEKDWDTEMKEAHFYFTGAEWDEKLRQAGFVDFKFIEEEMPTIKVDERIKINWDIPKVRLSIIAKKGEAFE